MEAILFPSQAHDSDPLAVGCSLWRDKANMSCYWTVPDGRACLAGSRRAEPGHADAPELALGVLMG
jgi:hypothetical protein